MANAEAIAREYGFTDGHNHNYDEDHDTSDGEVQEDSPGSSSAHSKIQNGSANVVTDRYGFLGGNQYTDPDSESCVPIDVLRKREVKWLDMIENWEKWMSKRFKKVKDRCRKGIPPSLRARAWQYLSGSKFLLEHNRGRFDELCQSPGDPKCIDDIEKDIYRQFPYHEMFTTRGGLGQEDLFMVLKAYTVHNPVDGYCQGQAPLAALLLMHMPAEQAFWCLVSICEKYLPGYYSMGLEAVKLDGDVLFGLIKRVLPSTYKVMKKQKIDPVLYMTEWFMCVFSRTLPWASVLRVWDMFFCEGVKVMFRISLTLFKFALGKPEQLAECPSLYETIEKLRKLPPEVLEEEFLIRESLKLPISELDMEKEHQFQLAKRKALKEKPKKTATESSSMSSLKKKSLPKQTPVDI